MTNVHKLSREIEELTTKLLCISDWSSREAYKVQEQLRKKRKQLEEAGI